MAMESVKLTNGEIIEVEFKSLGFRKASQIVRETIKIDELKFNKDSNETTLKSGNGIDYFGMSLKVFDSIPELKGKDVDTDSFNELYKKYYEKELMAAMGQNTNPN